MKVWIDQDLCTGDGLCEEIAPDVFTLLDDGLAYVREGDKIYAAAKGNPQGAEGMASFPESKLEQCHRERRGMPRRVHLHRAVVPTGVRRWRRAPQALLLAFQPRNLPVVKKPVWATMR